MRTHKNRWLEQLIAVGIMIMIFAFSFVYLNAAGTLMKWKKLDTMDTSLNVIENKAGDEDILLELDVEDAGDYVLTYYLEDGRKTEIEFTQAYSQLDIVYTVTDYDGGAETNITQDLLDLSYLEMNYDLSSPDWEFDGAKTVGASGGLEFSIERSASDAYPGVAFDINNKRVYIKWDFLQDIAYVQINDYEDGKVMPIEYQTPNKGSENMKVLKQLENFEVTPTHLKDDGGTNIELSPVVLPNALGDTPGNRPGLIMTFNQPMEMDPGTWAYNVTADLNDITAIFEFADIGTDAYLDFNFELITTGDQSISALPDAAGVNAGVEYDYNAGVYTVIIVQDKGDLNNQNMIIEWDELAASSIYDVNVGFQVGLGNPAYDDYEFANYKPESQFAYTYMEYELKRANVEEAYLDIQPYNAGDQDEVEYIILYSKVIKATLDPDEDLWLKNYHTSEDGNDEIFIPVPFRSTSSQDAYQVIVNFAGQEIFSQVLNYEAINDEDVPPTTPSINIVDNLFVVPPQDPDSDLPTKVVFDLQWDAPTNKVITELDSIFDDSNGVDDHLYYELSVNEVPTDSAENPFQVIKVFEVYKDVDDEYKIRLHADSPGVSTPSDFINFEDGYNETDEDFRMDGITIYDEDLYAGGWATVLDTVIDDVGNSYTVTDSGTAYDFQFPGVNYIRLKAIAVTDDELSTSQMSIPSSLALSLIKYDVPIVDNISYDPLYGIEEDRTSGVTLNWHTVDITTYESNMLTPIDYFIDDVIYSVYIAEEQSSILPLDADDVNYNLMPMDDDGLMAIDDTEIDLLRDGEVVYFELPTSKALNTDLSVDIQGLDVNSSYYIRIVTKIEVDDDEVAPGVLEIRRSDPSSVLGVTVPKAPKEPGDDEILPLAPENLVIDFADQSQISAGISWVIPDEMTFAENENGFEIVALEDRSLPSELRPTGVTVEDILTDPTLDNDVVEGWRLFVDAGTTVLRKYNRETDAWDDLNINLVNIDGDNFYVIDDANAPNKVNYYYVRTVKMNGTEVRSASPWSAGTLTTAPVKGPINLIVDYDTAYSYNPKEELIIRFDAPIPDVSDIGTDYIMEIHVKGEDDTDYSITEYPAVYLGTGTGTIGYERLFYRIEDLEPGKTYSIKVRIEDRTKPQEVLPDDTLAYPKSPFSDRIITRTEFDQEAYDKENKYFEYLNYYYTRAESLKELIYFRISSTSTETVVKYRENYMEGIIKRSSNGELILYSENKPINTYYIPSNSLETLNDLSVTLVLESKEQQIGIRPKTLGVGLTDEINQVIDDIARYNSSYDDYYLRIRLYTDTYNGKINDDVPTSPLVEVDIALVESRILEEAMDIRMVNQLDSVIESNKSELITRLEEELELGINDDRLLDIVEDMVDEVEIEYLGLASISFQGELNPLVQSIYDLNKAYYAALSPTDNLANNEVYTKQNGLYKKVDSSYFNNRYYVETTDLNPFVLLPSLSTNTDLVEIYSQQGIDVINAYDLSTVFSAYELDRPDEVIDKYQLLSALARTAGAEAGFDTIDYLKSKGIDISTTGSYQPITYEEALDVYVQTYAFVHRIDLERVNITNYHLIEDIGDVDDKYYDNLIRGANLGIIDTDSGPINPQHSITMAEVIELMITIHQGLY